MRTEILWVLGIKGVGEFIRWTVIGIALMLGGFQVHNILDYNDKLAQGPFQVTADSLHHSDSLFLKRVRELILTQQ
ncbi:hypothetical protein [Spirosoma foliorum]|uniref:Uncharacterized protein n=1 Tax=Spirosoma foliorum TaxID=2710596 RepID=A0A7G5H359_9BACT|nr:hypothetical protein [Spirosoma foliorum]QMW05551.1 hypothetical protein H3H32_12000 [Spirosoma foliorum]